MSTEKVYNLFSLRRAKNAYLCMILFAVSDIGFAAKKSLLKLKDRPWNKTQLPINYRLTDMQDEYIVPIQVKKIEDLTIPVNTLLTRIKLSKIEPTIEPLEIYVPLAEPKLERFAKQIARSSFDQELKVALKQKLKTLLKPFKGFKPEDFNKKTIPVKLDVAQMRLINPAVFTKILGQKHHSLFVETRNFDEATAGKFLNDLKFILPQENWQSVATKVYARDNISVDEDLLTEFPKQMLKKFGIYRGPNCFQAALSFHNPNISSSQFINIRQKEGYHPSMINHDELLRVLETRFYPINLKKSSLKFGDMLVFVDIPKGKNFDRFNFKWIKHASTYLFSGYTFSKGSKSPNSTYSVKTLLNEWNTWQDLAAGKSGVIVFRRSPEGLDQTPLYKLTEWMY